MVVCFFGCRDGVYLPWVLWGRECEGEERKDPLGFVTKGLF